MSKGSTKIFLGHKATQAKKMSSRIKGTVSVISSDLLANIALSYSNMFSYRRNAKVTFIQKSQLKIISFQNKKKTFIFNSYLIGQSF